MMKKFKKRILKIKKSIYAFTLTELLVTIAIIATVGSAAFFYLYNFKQVNALDQAAESTIAAIRYAQNQAIAGDRGEKWGVRVEKDATGQDYFAIYFGGTFATGTTISKSPYSSGIAVRATEDVNFTQLSGTIPSKKTIILELAANPLINRVITINDIGAVSIQANISELITVKSATLPTSRIYLSCAPDLNTGKLYCFGGYNLWDVNIFSDKIYEYNPATDTIITKTATLPSGRAGLSCATNVATNKMYCFGGLVLGGYLNQIIEYTPATESVIVKTATLPSARAYLSCSNNSFNNKIYCFGGLVNGPSYTNQIIEYDPATDTLVTKGATLPSSRAYLSCVPGQDSAGKIYCFGGLQISGYGTNQIIEYNPTTDTRVVKNAVLPSARHDHACALNPDTNKIYCLGGYTTDSFSYLNQIVEYDPLTDILAVKDSFLPTARNAHSCATNPNTAKIYCFGGFDGSTYVNQIVEYISGF